MKRSGNAAGRSPMEWAAKERRKARKGVRRRVTAWVGLNQEAKRADALTARAAHGAVGEQWTAALLAELPGGWTVFHGRQLPGFVADYDHVLISPCGTVVVVLDSKRWHAQRVTSLVRGRVHCGREDRHGQITAVARYAERLERALNVPGVSVLPLLVVHTSRVAGHFLSVPVEGLEEPVYVLDPGWLVSTLAECGRKMPADPKRAAAVVRRVEQVLPRYAE